MWRHNSEDYRLNFHHQYSLKHHPYINLRTIRAKSAATTNNKQPYQHIIQSNKTASVVPPEDGRLMPETCRGLRRHNKVFVKVKEY
jgi:hypothetical protein